MGIDISSEYVGVANYIKFYDITQFASQRKLLIFNDTNALSH